MKSVLAILILSLVACAGADVDPEPRQSLKGTWWVLTSLRGQDPIPGSRITLLFEGNNAGGYGGCNSYGSEIVLDGEKLKFGVTSSTLVGCFDPKGVQERDYFAALPAVATWTIDDGRLILLDAAGAAILEYAPETRQPMNSDDLHGTHWILQSEGGGPARVTIAFEEGRMHGFGGCRNYTGTWSATKQRFFTMSIAMGSTECDDLSALRAEERFTTDLSETTHYELRGDQLKFFTLPGRSLTFTRVEKP